MDERTLKALKGSIKKWEDIVHNGGVDNGEDNCPLCYIFIHQSCLDCPVYVRTGKEFCLDSPYTAWDNYHLAMAFDNPSTHGSSIVFDNKSKRFAQAELNFLKSLLPEEESMATGNNKGEVDDETVS